MKYHITKGSVFDDLGFSEEEARNLKVRAESDANLEKLLLEKRILSELMNTIASFENDLTKNYDSTVYLNIIFRAVCNFFLNQINILSSLAEFGDADEFIESIHEHLKNIIYKDD